MNKSIIFKALFCTLLFLTSSTVFASTSGYYEESTSGWVTLLAFIILISAILQIILFYKIWLMTNHIEEIRNKYIEKEIKFEDAKLPYILNKKDEAFRILNLCMENKIKKWIAMEMKQILIDRSIKRIEEEYYEAIGMKMPLEYKEFKIAQYVSLFNKDSQTAHTQKQTLHSH